MKAINIADLTKYADDFGLMVMIGDVVKTSHTLRCESCFDGDGAVLDCEDTRSKSIVEIIRGRYGKNDLRCYALEGRIWKRI